MSGSRVGQRIASGGQLKIFVKDTTDLDNQDKFQQMLAQEQATTSIRRKQVRVAFSLQHNKKVFDSNDK